MTRLLAAYLLGLLTSYVLIFYWAAKPDCYEEAG